MSTEVSEYRQREESIEAVNAGNIPAATGRGSDPGA